MKFTVSFAVTLFTFFASFNLVLSRTSKPFYLQIVSNNADLKDHTLGACHAGAALEALCKASKIPNADTTYQTFQFNYTNSQPNNGILSWKLHADNLVGTPSPF